MSNPNRDEQIEQELLFLYQRIDANAACFGMSKEEVDLIKRQCATAYRHKLVLDKAQKRRSE